MPNMAMTKEEAKEYGGLCAAPEQGGDSGPRYPWGLQITLDDGSLEKLGITDLPPVGTVLMIQARAEVTGTRSSQQQAGDKEQRVEMQITDMEIAPPAADDAARANKLYGGG